MTDLSLLPVIWSFAKDGECYCAEEEDGSEEVETSSPGLKAVSPLAR